MQRRLVLLMLVAVVLGSCSSSDPQAFDLAQPMAAPPVAFTISGEAVEKGTVCPDGTFIHVRMEDMDGNEVSDEDWMEMFDTAFATNSVAEIMSFQEFECGDGSGTITVANHVRFDFAVLDAEDLTQGQTKHGTWTLEGTGDYESLTGSGDTIGDNDTQIIHMVGEVET